MLLVQQSFVKHSLFKLLSDLGTCVKHGSLYSFKGLMCGGCI
jgi:hypothetical protein